MKLYYAPNACSLAIHILLEEIGAPYALQLVNLQKGEQHGADYVALNPKAKVPMLERENGTRLTELPAIAWYLARRNPQAGLLPADLEAEARALELIDYLIATVHMRGFTRIFRPGVFSPTPEDREKVIQAGKDIVSQGFGILADALGGQDYLLGDYSIADIVLFFLEFWGVSRAGLALPAPLAGHLRRLQARPAVQRALRQEGLAAA